MKAELGDFYKLVAYWRSFGLTEPEAYKMAEEVMESEPSDQEVKVN